MTVDLGVRHTTARANAYLITSNDARFRSDVTFFANSPAYQDGFRGAEVLALAAGGGCGKI
jgi:hypothetical protein